MIVIHPVRSVLAALCAALRWVKHNIAQFGGDPGQRHDRWAVGRRRVRSRPAGLASLAWAVPASDRPERRVRADPAAARCRRDGEAFAAKAGCPDQTAECLRRLPVDVLVNNLPGAAIPARWPRTRTSHAPRCRSTAGPLSGCQRSPTSSTTTARPSGSHRCRWQRRTHRRSSTASVSPTRPPPARSPADQQALAASMRAAWASFAADGDPSTQARAWPSFNQGERAMSLLPPDSEV